MYAWMYVWMQEAVALGSVSGMTGLDVPGLSSRVSSGLEGSGGRGIRTVDPPEHVDVSHGQALQDHQGLAQQHPGLAQQPSSHGGGTAERGPAQGSTQEAGLGGTGLRGPEADTGGSGPQLPTPSQRNRRTRQHEPAPMQQGVTLGSAGVNAASQIPPRTSHDGPSVAPAPPLTTEDPGFPGKRNGRGRLLPALQVGNNMTVDPGTVIMPNFKRSEDFDADSEEGQGAASGASTSTAGVADASQAVVPFVAVPSPPTNLPVSNLTEKDLEEMLVSSRARL